MKAIIRGTAVEAESVTQVREHLSTLQAGIASYTQFNSASARAEAAWDCREHPPAAQLVLKRVMDIAIAGVGLVALLPLMCLVAIVVRMDTVGPAFFSQERLGRGGRRFKMHKFRTMIAGAESQRAKLSECNIYSDPRLFKVRVDPRITRVGRWLRKTSLDELPQLLNVLWGEMSLVGPRPPLEDEAMHYSERDWGRLRVRPGITGPWQIAGRSDIVDFDVVFKLECDYLTDWSLGRDIRILLETIPVVLSTRGAH